jgi:hypothetical protein
MPVDRAPFSRWCGLQSRSSTFTLPDTEFTPAAVTCAARSFRPVSGSSVVRVAPGMTFAALWSTFMKSTVPSGLARPSIVRSPWPTRIRSPANTPSAISRPRWGRSDPPPWPGPPGDAADTIAVDPDAGGRSESEEIVIECSGHGPSAVGPVGDDRAMAQQVFDRDAVSGRSPSSSSRTRVARGSVPSTWPADPGMGGALRRSCCRRGDVRSGPGR